MNAIGAKIGLPEPVTDGKISVESALLARCSTRNFKNLPLRLEEVSQLLWAAQGVTHRENYRTCPSAGATYPLEIHLVTGDVSGLAAGTYRYQVNDHSLAQERTADLRSKLAEAALGQSMIACAPASLAISAVYERTTRRYGQRGIRYVFMEAGHAAQNVHLQAEALGLGTVVIGAFQDDRIKEILGLRLDEEPLYLMPFGRWLFHLRFIPRLLAGR